MTTSFSKQAECSPINRPRFESRLLNRTVCIDEVADLSDTELEIIKDELGETLTTLQAALDEAYVLYKTPDQMDPGRYGRMRYKSRILYGLQRRLNEEFGKRIRLSRQQASRQLGALFIGVAKRELAPELFHRILREAQGAMSCAARN